MNFNKSSQTTLIYYLFINIAVCLAYVVTAKIGLSLALPPGIASPIWPPSGIAITAVILFENAVLPGIYLGSAIVNTLASKTDGYSSLLLANLIASGSTLQAFLGAYALKKAGINQDLFKSYKQVFYFLGIALVSCLTSSSIGTLSLYFTHAIEIKLIFNTWTTWWLGDTAGIIVFTPFLLIWTRPINLAEYYHKGFEAFQFLIITSLLALLSFGWILQKGYPIEYTLLPCLMWAVFRFGAHGATLTLVAVLIVAVWGTAKGYGPFVQHTLNESLILLQVFIGVVSATTLTLIAVLNELKQTTFLLEESNRDLELKIQNKTATLQEKTLQLQQKTKTLEKTLEEFALTQKRVIVREKLASLGDLTAGIAHQMRNPLNFVINLAELSQNSLEQLIQKINQNTAIDNLEGILQNIKTHIKKILQHGRNANSIIETMIKHAQGTSGAYEQTNINALIEQYTKVSYQSMQARDEAFDVHLIKNYDSTLEKVETIPQDLFRAFANILNNAFEAVNLKNIKMGASYQPSIEIKTENLNDKFAISIRDNGIGISQANMKKVFHPFFTTKTSGSAGFGLSITYDLIVQNLGGEIKVDSIENEYASFTLILPKLRPSHRIAPGSKNE